MGGQGIAAVDVVVPCYNAGSFLGEAIESILSQGAVSVRIIVIDDGSSDGSAEVARAFAPRVEVHSQPNRGIAAARNAGIARARAEWLTFLDADDVWTPGSLAARLEVFASRPDADLVFGRLLQFHSPELDEQARAGLQFDQAPSAGRFAGTLLARCSSFRRVGFFDESLRVGEMIDWLSRAEAASLVVARTEHVSLRRRIHGGNTTLDGASSHAHYLRALKASIDRGRTAPGRAETP